MKRINWNNVRLVVMILVVVVFLYSFSSKQERERWLKEATSNLHRTMPIFITHDKVNKLLIQNYD